ncbi:hypothetical protein [Halogeometricum limi]|uniref:Uncharacterized protein n=1 Tax=Halogeometricum limi TaxID=555875 RepID=A0A1I6HBR6_9EURY|nr:hypothetical protein [Halogeometricum limi]SFR51966.1 hypothetical protein SAMN04488124_2036 [Halogeometricum limi]
MNRDDVDTQWLLTGVVALVGFALLDRPATLTEYAIAGTVLAVVFAGAVYAVRANRRFRLVALVTCFGIATVTGFRALDEPNVVVAWGVGGMFSALVVVEFVGEAYRHRSDD